jgi:hypothetical protein
MTTASVAPDPKIPANAGKKQPVIAAVIPPPEPIDASDADIVHEDLQDSDDLPEPIIGTTAIPVAVDGKKR